MIRFVQERQNEHNANNFFFQKNPKFSIQSMFAQLNSAMVETLWFVIKFLNNQFFVVVSIEFIMRIYIITMNLWSLINSISISISLEVNESEPMGNVAKEEFPIDFDDRLEFLFFFSFW